MANDLGLFVQPDTHKVVVSSRDVARVFERNHRDVLRNIRELECSEGFTERNFALSEYKDEKGELRPEYLITRDGFTFLAMGFTGAKAAAFKEAYIEAFNRMERALFIQEHDALEPPDYKKARFMLDGLTAFKDVMPYSEKRRIMCEYYELIGSPMPELEELQGGFMKDPIESFVDERVVPCPGARLSREDFYAGLCKWLQEQGGYIPSRCRAIRAVNRLGRFRTGRSSKMRYWEGVSLA